jgi:hypothetical protein
MASAGRWDRLNLPSFSKTRPSALWGNPFLNAESQGHVVERPILEVAQDCGRGAFTRPFHRLVQQPPKRASFSTRGSRFGHPEANSMPPDTLDSRVARSSEHQVTVS